MSVDEGTTRVLDFSTLVYDSTALRLSPMHKHFRAGAGPQPWEQDSSCSVVVMQVEALGPGRHAGFVSSHSTKNF